MLFPPICIQVLVSDIEEWEATHGQIPQGAIVLICSGWDLRWPHKLAVFGNDRDDVTDFHYPGFHGDTAAWLVANRNIYGVSSDSPSIDAGNVRTSVAHRILMATNVYALENVKGTCDIPASGATINVNPMKIEGASGGPARIIATWGENGGCTGSSPPLVYSWWSVMMVTVIMAIK